MYTDGSQCEKGTGAGVVVFSNFMNDNPSAYSSYKLKCHMHASVFTAELSAIEAAVNSVKKNENTTCTIYSDSKSALQAILVYDSKNSIVRNIHFLLSSLKEKNVRIKFCWVPAHCGIVGNEMADKVAKQATKYSKKCTFPLSLSDIKAYLKSEAKSKWQQQWNSLTNNKLFEVDPNIGKKDFSGFHSRLDEIKFTRVRLGHTKLTQSYLFDGIPQPACNVCNCALTIKHLLIECPKYEPERFRFFGAYEVKLCNILERGNPQRSSKLIDFLKFTRLYNYI